MEDRKKCQIICIDECGCERASYYCSMTNEQIYTIDNFLKLVYDNNYRVRVLTEEDFIEL